MITEHIRLMGDLEIGGSEAEGWGEEGREVGLGKGIESTE